jgi:hypothetical protein
MIIQIIFISIVYLLSFMLYSLFVFSYIFHNKYILDKYCNKNIKKVKRIEYIEYRFMIFLIISHYYIFYPIWFIVGKITGYNNTYLNVLVKK